VEVQTTGRLSDAARKELAAKGWKVEEGAPSTEPAPKSGQ
jgi:hypothetical protein